jgi:hypothetical protein
MFGKGGKGGRYIWRSIAFVFSIRGMISRALDLAGRLGNGSAQSPIGIESPDSIKGLGA